MLWFGSLVRTCDWMENFTFNSTPQKILVVSDIESCNGYKFPVILLNLVRSWFISSLWIVSLRYEILNLAIWNLTSYHIRDASPTFLAKFIWDVNGACSFTRSVTCASPLSPANFFGAVKVVYDCLFQGYKVELETNWSFFYSDSTFLCILLNNRNFRLVWANVGILSMHSFYFGVYIAQAGILDCSMY
jgi:hypothetical protein